MTVVFIHGLSGDRTDFAPQVAFFRDRYEVVAVDLPGAGDSGRARSRWTMEAFGEDAAAVVNHLDPDRVVLVGHSLGGNVIAEAALLLDGRVEGLVMVSSLRSLDSDRDEGEIDAFLTPFAVDFPAAMDDLNRRNFGPNADPRLVEAVISRARSADRERVMGLLDSYLHHLPAVRDALSRIEAPVFAINPDFKPNDTESFAREGIELRIIPGVGHFVMMEAPQAFNAELLDILGRFS